MRSKEANFVVGSDHDEIGEIVSRKGLPPFLWLLEIPVAGVIPALQSHKHGGVGWARIASANFDSGLQEGVEAWLLESDRRSAGVRITMGPGSVCWRAGNVDAGTR